MSGPKGAVPPSSPLPPAFDLSMDSKDHDSSGKRRKTFPILSFPHVFFLNFVFLDTCACWKLGYAVSVTKTKIYQDSMIEKISLD